MKTKFLTSVIEAMKNFLKSVFNFKKNSKDYPPIEVQFKMKKPEKVTTFSVKMNETEQFCQLEVYRLPFEAFEILRSPLIPLDSSGNIQTREQVLYGEIVSYYQPDSGVFWSDLKPVENDFWKELVEDTLFSSDSKVFFYLSKHKVAHFSILVEDLLLIRESHMHYESIFEAYERVISVIENNNQELADGGFYRYRWYSCLPLESDYIDHDFFYPETVKFDPFDCADHCIPTMVKIINVTRQQDCWKIELEGNHGRQAQLILRNQLENQEEPILLQDYYQNNNYEVLEVWVDGVKKEIPQSPDK